MFAIVIKIKSTNQVHLFVPNKLNVGNVLDLKAMSNKFCDVECHEVETMNMVQLKTFIRRKSKP